MTSNLQLSIHNHVAHLQLCNTKTLNALSTEFCHEIDQAVQDFDHNDEVKVILISSAAKHFCAGADIEEMRSLSIEKVVETDFVGCVKYLGQANKPIVVAVNGMALGGGCELVEMCDIVIAASSAKFAHPEITLAAMPGAGGTQRLARAIGKAQSFDMLLTGRSLTSQEALAAGLVSRVVEDDHLLPTAIQIAEKIATFSSPVTQRIKASLKNNWELPIKEGLREEMRLFHMCFTDPDFAEGLAAFSEKRPPKFKS